MIFCILMAETNIYLSRSETFASLVFYVGRAYKCIMSFIFKLGSSRYMNKTTIIVFPYCKLSSFNMS